MTTVVLELVSLGGIGTGTGCAGCSLVEISVLCEEHIQSHLGGLGSLRVGVDLGGIRVVPGESRVETCWKICVFACHDRGIKVYLFLAKMVSE